MKKNNKSDFEQSTYNDEEYYDEEYYDEEYYSGEAAEESYDEEKAGPLLRFLGVFNLTVMLLGLTLLALGMYFVVIKPFYSKDNTFEDISFEYYASGTDPKQQELIEPLYGNTASTTDAGVSEAPSEQ